MRNLTILIVIVYGLFCIWSVNSDAILYFVFMNSPDWVLELMLKVGILC